MNFRFTEMVEISNKCCIIALYLMANLNIGMVFAQKGRSNRMRAKVLWAAAGDIPAGWPLLSHTHPFFHMFYIRSGKARFLLDGQPRSVNGGQCLLVRPGVAHELPEGHGLLDLYEVKFSVSDETILRSLEHVEPVIGENTAYIEQATEYIVHNWNSRTNTEHNDADLFLLSMLLVIANAPNASQSFSSAYVVTDTYTELTKRIICFLEETHTDPFSLDALARQMEYNKRYLCAAFKQDTGITILEYLNHVRIRHAAVCFYYNDVPVSDIAQCVGFITPVHFTRVFKKATGVTPSQFRSVHSLQRIDASENLRLTRTHISAYEQMLDGKILPLQKSLAVLQELGRMAAEYV